MWIRILTSTRYDCQRFGPPKISEKDAKILDYLLSVFFSEVNITILHYNHRRAVIIGFLGMSAKLSDICVSCLAKFSSSFSHSRLKIRSV